MGLMLKNETLLAKNVERMKQLKEWEIVEENLSRIKQKNLSLKMKVKACHNRERSIL